MTPQETHAAVVSLLQQQGLPLTTANLNRGMLALAQNDMSTDGAALPAVNRSMDRTMGVAQQAASRPATTQQPLPTPPIPPTATTQQPPQQVAPTTLELNSPGSLPAGVRNSIEAFLTNGSTQPTPVQQTVPDGSASSLVDAPRTPTLERSAPPDNLYNYGADEQAVHVPTVERMAPQANAYNADVAGITPDMLAIEGVPGANVYNADTAGKAPSIPKEPGRIMSGINSAVKYAQDAMTLPPSRTQQPFSLETIGEDIRNGRVPNPNPDLPLILFGTGPVGLAGRAYPAMQQFMRQRTMDIMRQNPQRPPSNMLNQAGDGYEEALAARARTSQRPAYKGEGVDDFIQGGNSTQPTPSMKQNIAPTWKGEADPSAPMGTRSTPSGTQSLPKQTNNTAAPHTPAQDTSGAGAAIKQTLTKRKQMAASKSTRKSKD